MFLLFWLACAHPVAPEAPPVAVAVDGATTHETLELDGTPEIPDEIRARMNQYLNIRSASLSDLSPDGTSMLISTRFSEVSQIHEVTQPLGARTQLTFGGEPSRNAEYSGDRMMYMSDIGGNEAYQIFEMDRETGSVSMLTDGVNRHGGFVWSNNREQFAYTHNGRNGKDMDIYLAPGGEVDVGAPPILEVEGMWYPAAWSPDDRFLLLGEYISASDSRIHLLDIDSGAVTRITPADPLAVYHDAVFSQDGETLYVTTDREGEFVTLYGVNVSDNTWTPLTPEIDWNVGSVVISPDGSTLAFVVNEDGISALFVHDIAAGESRRITAVPAGRIGGLQYADEANVLGFTLGTATAVYDIYTLDAAETLTRWTASEIGGLNTDLFIEPTLVRFPSFDSLEIPSFYYRPRGEGPFPVVMMIHGGPESQSRIGFSSQIQYLVNELNIAVLVPNVRGSAGYGKTRLAMDNGFQREDSVKDIGALLDWIAEQPELDSGRVGVSGGSYGGYMVLASLVHYSDRIRAGVDVVGISNFVTFLENTKEYRRDLRRVEYGDERDPEMRAFLETISPSNNAEKIQSALFVAHGANDPRVPLGEARQIVSAVRDQGQDVWLMVAHDEGHGFRKKENRDTYLLLSTMFFGEQLLSAE